MGTKEASEKWGYSQSTIQKWCREEKIFLVIRAEKSKHNCIETDWLQRNHKRKQHH